MEICTRNFVETGKLNQSVEFSTSPQFNRQVDKAIYRVVEIYQAQLFKEIMGFYLKSRRKNQTFILATIWKGISVDIGSMKHCFQNTHPLILNSIVPARHPGANISKFQNKNIIL